ncbi:MAG: LEA type 2 family protein [Bacteroidota bacterium]
MRINPFILVPVAYLLYRGASKGYGASRLGYNISKIVPRFKDFAFILDFYIGIQNPTGESFQIQSLSGDLFANDNSIGTVSSFTLTDVKPNAQTIMIVSARLPLLGLGAELWNALQGGVTSISQKLKIVGTVNIGGIPLPVTMTYNVL